MQVVIDSVSMLSLLRPSKLTKKSKRSAQSYESPLDKYMRLEKIKLAIDSSRGLISEWARTCGSPELIQVLVTRWEELRGIFLIENPPRPKQAISKRLRILGFGLKSPIDTLVLRLALGTNDRIVVSEDSDFWHPYDIRMKGKPNAPVARLCKEELGVTILLLGMLMRELKH